MGLSPKRIILWTFAAIAFYGYMGAVLWYLGAGEPGFWGLLVYEILLALMIAWGYRIGGSEPSEPSPAALEDTQPSLKRISIQEPPEPSLRPRRRRKKKT